MSLDKWMKPEKKKEQVEKEPKKKPSEKKEVSKETLDKTPLKINKYNLICSKKSCGYHKIIMKKSLSEKDKSCPRCKSMMKIKK